jgi:hypothetical protein
MRSTIEMAREVESDAGFQWCVNFTELARFEYLARADERKIVMSTPLTKEMWQRFEDEIRADERSSWLAEREAMERQISYLTDALVLADRYRINEVWAERGACAKEADKWSKRDDDVGAFIGKAIRARGETK